MEPYSRTGYVNHIAEDESREKVRASYGSSHQRLRELKAKMILRISSDSTPTPSPLDIPLCRFGTNRTPRPEYDRLEAWSRPMLSSWMRIAARAFCLAEPGPVFALGSRRDPRTRRPRPRSIRPP